MISKSLRIILLLLTIIACNCYSQSLSRDLKKYAKLTNEAMLDIADGQIKESTQKFKKAFRLKELPFPEDLENAIIACIKTGQRKQAIKYAFLLSNYGVGSAYFKHHAFVDSLSIHPEWQTLLSFAEADKTKKDQNYFDLKIKIQQLVELDQKYATIRQETQKTDPLANEKFRVISDSISSELNLVFQQTGFLTTDKIGVNLNEDYLIDSSPFYNVLIIHNFGGLARLDGHSDTIFKPYLDKALFEGKITPAYYARTLEWKSDLPKLGKREDNSNFRFGLSTCNVYKCTLYGPKIDEASEHYKKILLNRDRIGLNSMEDFHKLTAANLVKAQADFNFHAVTSGVSRIANFADTASEQSFLERSVKIIDIPDCQF